MITTIVAVAVGFVVACVVAVKYGPWFKKTSTTVTQDVTNVENNIKKEVTTNGNNSGSTPSGS
jgi:hypothetical protein